MISRLPAISLRLLGGFILERDGRPVTGRAVQRRRMAVLALLAGSSGRSMSRDRVIGLLWPEATAESARHHLADAVYALRRALGEEAIRSRGDDLILNPELLQLDLATFEEALASDDPAAACALYRGPFAEGLFVSGAAEFDSWLEATREQYRRSFRGALERLALCRAAAGELQQASDAWLRLTRDDPADGRVVLQAVRCLDLTGNRAAALGQARAHLRLLRNEIGAEPSGEMLSLVADLERRAAAEPLAAPGLDERTPDSPSAPRRPVSSLVAAGLGVALLAGFAVVAIAGGAGPDGNPAQHLLTVVQGSASGAESAEAFSAGERAYHQGRHLAAVAEFRHAVAADSTLALGWYRLSQSILAADLPEPQAAQADLAALQHADRLPDREQLRLRAWREFRQGNAETAEERYRNLVSLYPEDLDGWLQLGETLFHYNPLRGRSIAEAIEPFETALRLESSNRDALWHLAQLHAHAGRVDRFAALTDRLLGLDPEPARQLELSVLRAIALHDSTTLQRSMPRLHQTDELRLYQLFWRTAVFLGDLAAAERIALILSAGDRPQYSRMIGYSGRVSLAAARGQVNAMQSLLDSLSNLGLGGVYQVELDRYRVNLLDRLMANGETRLTHPEATLDSLERGSNDMWFGLALTNTNVQRLDARFLRAESLFRLGRYQEALGWYGSFAQHSPGDLAYLPRALIRRGEALERLGRFDEAAAEFRRLLDLWQAADPVFTPLRDSLSRRLAALGQN